MLYTVKTSRIGIEAKELQESSLRHSNRYEGILSAVGAGFFLLLIGMLFVTIPGLSDSIVSYVTHFRTVQVGGTSVYLPAPIDVHPIDATLVYSAVWRFSIIWAVFLVALLIARFVVHSPARRKAEELGNVVFWFGTVYLVQTYLVGAVNFRDPTNWFLFWATVVILIGVSFVVRGIFLTLFSIASPRKSQ